MCCYAAGAEDFVMGRTRTRVDSCGAAQWLTLYTSSSSNRATSVA